MTGSSHSSTQKKPPQEEESTAGKTRLERAVHQKTATLGSVGSGVPSPMPHTEQHAGTEFTARLKYETCCLRQCPGRSLTEKQGRACESPGPSCQTQGGEGQVALPGRQYPEGLHSGKSSLVWQLVGGRGREGISLPACASPKAKCAREHGLHRPQGWLCRGGLPHLHRTPCGSSPCHLAFNGSLLRRNRLPQGLAGCCGENHGSRLKQNGTKPKKS